VQSLHRQRGDQRRLLGRLGQHRVAGGQRGGHLAGEDRQRKVPRADANHRAQRPVRGVVPALAQLQGVVAQKVDGLAHLGHGVGHGLARFTQQQRDQRRLLRLQGVGGPLQHRGALRGRGGGPAGGCLGGDDQC
jgi:hypothetical protein